MTTKERLKILKAELMDTITQCGDLLCAVNVEIAGLREQVEELEGWPIRTDDCSATLRYKCWACDAEKCPSIDAWLAERDDELTGSIGGLDDVTLRVKIQSPAEHAWITRQRWYRATQTPVPLWTTGGNNGNV